MEEGTEPLENVAVEPEQAVDVVEEQTEIQESQDDHQEEQQNTQVPLSALQKERQRRKESELRSQQAEIELRILKEQAQKQAEPEEDDSELYESATRADLKNTSQTIRSEVAREIREETWIDNNSEKAAFVDEHLPKFLKQRPNWASAISTSKNRYKEAYDLITALSPKQQQQAVVQKKQRPTAPNSPTAIPKSAVMDQAVDLMSLSDEEYRNWVRDRKRVAK